MRRTWERKFLSSTGSCCESQWIDQNAINYGASQCSHCRQSIFSVMTLNSHLLLHIRFHMRFIYVSLIGNFFVLCLFSFGHVRSCVIVIVTLYICKNKELESLQLEKYYKPAIKHQFLQARISLNIVSCGSVSNVSLLLPNANAYLSFTHDMNTLKTYRKIKRSDLRQVWDSVST